MEQAAVGQNRNSINKTRDTLTLTLCNIDGATVPGKQGTELQYPVNKGRSHSTR